MTEIAQKLCPHCGIWKPVDQGFYLIKPTKRHKTVASCWCRECTKQRERARYHQVQGPAPATRDAPILPISVLKRRIAVARFLKLAGGGEIDFDWLEILAPIPPTKETHEIRFADDRSGHRNPATATHQAVQSDRRRAHAGSQLGVERVHLQSRLCDLYRRFR